MRIVIALVLLAPLSSAAQEKERPNIVLFLADDLGWGDLGCYGHARMKTPNLDAFAAQGVRFTQCTSAGSVCSPSRSALLSGRTPQRTGIYDWIPPGSEMHFRSSEDALPKLLKQAGYQTCHAGKWHLNGKFNSPEQPQPGDHGYDWWLATQNNAAPSHKNPNNFVRNGEAVGKMEGFSAALVAGEAVRWLREKRDPSKPFFVAVWTHEPHLPIESDPKFQEPYADLEPDFRQHHGDVSQMDHAFGTLMKALDDLGVASKTMVFFTADNGPEGDGLKGRTRGSTGGLRGRKRALYEGGIRVPGLLRWPGRAKPGTTCEEPVVGSDFFPTALEAAGVMPPAGKTLDGTSFLPALEGRALERKVPMYWRYNRAPQNMETAMRQGDWKILAPADLSRFELYNLKSDPRETENLVAKEPERLKSMSETLAKFHREIEAEGPKWPPAKKKP